MINQAKPDDITPTLIIDIKQKRLQQQLGEF